MSDPSSRLNLIQRAIEREASARKPARPNQATQENRATVGSDPAPVSGAPDEILASAPPSIRAGAAPSIRAELVEPLQAPLGQAVRIDAAKLAESRIGTVQESHSVSYNEFRALKRKLLPMIADPETGALTRNVVMVTSALPGEGKTFTTMNLAFALAAEPNLNVILVDGDSVRGSIATYFQPSYSDGLLELLTEKRERLDEVLHPCADLPRLHVLFSGARHDATPELLASRRMGELCAALSARFPQTIVLFDTPPVLAASEATAMATHVHHLLMVVAAGRSKRNQVEAALTEVSRCPSMSVVFNRSPEWDRPLSDMYSRPYAYASEQANRA
jgi:receptor protein-tyrosine kinase